MVASYASGFAIDAKADITPDRHAGRCWFQVYDGPADEFGVQPRVLSVEFVIARDAGAEQRDEWAAAALALAHGSAWLNARIAQLERGKEYHVTVTSAGQMETQVAELSD